MPFESIIITGTSCAGKTTVTQALCAIFRENNQRFKLAEAVTTREKREDDINYEYITDETFDNLKSKGKLIVSTTYRDKKYGIKEAEYKKILNENKIPVLIITPSAAKELLSNLGQEKHMCFFLDAPDEQLLERWEARETKKPDDKAKRLF